MTSRRIAKATLLLIGTLLAWVLLVAAFAADWGLVALLSAVTVATLVFLLILLRRPGLQRRIRAMLAAPGAVQMTSVRVAKLESRLNRLERVSADISAQLSRVAEDVTAQLEETRNAVGRYSQNGEQLGIELRALARENARAIVRLSLVIQEMAAVNQSTQIIGGVKNS